MNIKFFFVVLVVALVLTACAPAIKGASAPLAEPKLPILVPMTGEENAAVVRPVAEPRLFSGEIILSDNNNPDYELDITTNTGQKSQSECMSEDSQPKRASGCIE